MDRKIKKSGKVIYALYFGVIAIWLIRLEMGEFPFFWPDILGNYWNISEFYVLMVYDKNKG